MKPLITVIIVIFIALVTVTISSLVMYNFIITNLKKDISENDKILAYTKASEITFQLTDYHHGLVKFTELFKENYQNSKFLQNSYNKLFKKTNKISRIYAISNNKILFSYPIDLSLNDKKRALNMSSYFEDMKVENNNLNKMPKISMRYRVPFMESLHAMNILLAETYINSKTGKSKVLFILETNINKILRIEKDKFRKIKNSTVWLFNSKNIIVGSSRNFINREQATLYYNKFKHNNDSLIKDKEFIDILGVTYKIEIIRNSDDTENIVFPYVLKASFIGSHIFLISMFLLVIIFMLYRELKIRRLNRRISTLNIQLNKQDKKLMIKDITSSDYFKTINELADGMKKDK